MLVATPEQTGVLGSNGGVLAPQDFLASTLNGSRLETNHNDDGDKAGEALTTT